MKISRTMKICPKCGALTPTLHTATNSCRICANVELERIRERDLEENLT